MSLATFDASGFEVTASNAVDLIAGTQAAGSGMVSANIQEVGSMLSADLHGVNSTLIRQTEKLANVSETGFASLGDTIGDGFTSLTALSGASLAVQAVGFATVATQLHGLRGEMSQMREELVAQGQELIVLQETTNAHLESLVAFAATTLETQEKILETLVTSKTVEAQQYIRQGWDNLVNGYVEDAFERFQRSLEYDNTVYTAHAEMARIFDQRREDEAAEDHYVRAIRFSEKAGEDLQGFAHVQYAQFLAGRDRLDEAFEEVEKAMGFGGIEDSIRGSWQLFGAEVAALQEDADRALARVEKAITLNEACFVAAMASDDLQGLQPILTKRLVEIDEQRRASVIDAMKPIVQALQPLDVIDTDLADEYRAESIELFERALLAPFPELFDIEKEVQRHQSKIEEASESLLNSRLDSIQTRLSEFRDDLTSKQPERPQSVSGKGIATGAFLAGSFVVWGLTTLVCLVGAGIGPTIFVSLTLGGLLGVIGASMMQSSSAAGGIESVMQAESWLEWRDRRAVSIYSFWSDVHRMYKSAHEAQLSNEQKNRMADVLRTVKPPSLPSVPTWAVSDLNDEREKLQNRVRHLQRKHLNCEFVVPHGQSMGVFGDKEIDPKLDEELEATKKKLSNEFEKLRAGGSSNEYFDEYCELMRK